MSYIRNGNWSSSEAIDSFTVSFRNHDGMPLGQWNGLSVASESRRRCKGFLCGGYLQTGKRASKSSVPPPPGVSDQSHLFEFRVMCCMLITFHVSSRIVTNAIESLLPLSHQFYRPCCGKQGKSEGFDSCDRPNNLTRISWKSACVTLKFDVWPRKTIGNFFHAPRYYVCHFIAFREFKSLPWIQTRVIVQKHLNRSQIINFSPHVTLKFDGWPSVCIF